MNKITCAIEKHVSSLDPFIKTKVASLRYINIQEKTKGKFGK